MSFFPFLGSWFSLLVSTIILHTFWQSFLIAGIAVLWLKLARNETAEHRYRIAMMAMILCLWLPLVNFFWITGSIDRDFGTTTATRSFPVVSLNEIQGNRSTKEVIKRFFVNQNWLVEVEEEKSLRMQGRRRSFARINRGGTFDQPSKRQSGEIGNTKTNEKTKGPPPKSAPEKVIPKTGPEVGSFIPSSSSGYSKLGNTSFSLDTATENEKKKKTRSVKYHVNWVVVLSSLLTCSYFLGLIVLGIRLFSFRNNLAGTEFVFTSGSTDLSERVLCSAGKAASRLKFAGRVSIRFLESVPLAAVEGVFRPTIVMNVSLISGLSPTQLEMVLAHEIVHILKWDLPALWLQRFTETLLFFCPAVHILGRVVSRLREIRCDATVASKYCPAEYAETLVECAGLQGTMNRKQATIPLGLTAVANATSFLGQRVKTLLATPIPRQPTNWKTSQIGAAVIVITASATLLFGPIRNTLFTSKLNEEMQEKKVDSVGIVRFDQPGWNWINPDLEEIRQTDFRLAGKSFPLKRSYRDGLSIERSVKGTENRFAKFQVGDSASRPVSLMLTLPENSPSCLFCDRDRNNRFSAEEKCRRIQIGKSGNLRKVAFLLRADAIVQSGKLRLKSERLFLAIPHQDGLSLQIHTLGYAEGKIKWQGKECVVRRYDRDSDGIANGSRDVFELDLNGDKSFDWVTERFLMKRSVQIEGKLASVFSDPMGMALELKPPGVTGSLKIDSPVFDTLEKDRKYRIECFEIKLENEQGMIARTDGINRPLALPPGKYRITEVSIQVRDRSDCLWGMDLVGEGLEDQWFRVVSGETKKVSVLEKLRLGIKSWRRDINSGQVTVSPVVRTDGGLIVTRFDKEDGVDVSAFQGNPVSMKFFSRQVGDTAESPGFGCGFM